jgi:hypothetical protein
MMNSRGSRPRRALGAAALAVMAVCGSRLQAIDLDVTTADIEAVLAAVRGPAAALAAFHAPYIVPVPDPEIERLEVITERRRLALLAEARIAQGDPLFARGTLPAEEALRPWRRRVSVTARFRFAAQNAYTLAPPIDIAVIDSPVARLEMRGETLFALPSGIAGQSVPVVGAVGEARFDAAAIGQGEHTIVVRLGNREAARIRIDFGRLD